MLWWTGGKRKGGQRVNKDAAPSRTDKAYFPIAQFYRLLWFYGLCIHDLIIELPQKLVTLLVVLYT
jgi:hypothetical protein